jgi:hypothetical protein
MDEWIYVCKDNDELIYENLVIHVPKPPKTSKRFIKKMIVVTQIIILMKDWIRIMRW